MARRQAPAARRCECDAVMQFIKGIDEPCVPDIKLTRSKDGSNGVGTSGGVTGSIPGTRPVCIFVMYRLLHRAPLVSMVQPIKPNVTPMA